MNIVCPLLTNQNRNPSSIFENIGDRLISPIPILLDRNPFIVLRNENERLIYRMEHCTMRNYYSQKNKLGYCIRKTLSIIFISLVIIGLVFKSLSLLTSKETREIYKNWNKDTIIASYPSEYRKIVQTAQEKGLFIQLVNDFEKYRNDYLSRFKVGGHGCTINLFSTLRECGCGNGDFDRFQNTRRINLEKKLIKDSLKKFPNKTKPLNYASLGCGGLLQDLFHINGLIQKGYKKLNITLIDPDYYKKSEEEKLLMCEGNKKILSMFESFVKAKANQKNVKVSIKHFKSLKDFSKTDLKKQIDIFSVVDFDDINYEIDAIIDAQSKLSKDGFLHLSFFDKDFELNKNGITAFYKFAKGLNKELLENMKSFKNRKMRIACIYGFNITEMLNLIIIAKHCQLKNLEITIYNKNALTKKIITFLNMFSKNQKIQLKWEQAKSFQEIVNIGKSKKFNIVCFDSSVSGTFETFKDYRNVLNKLENEMKIIRDSKITSVILNN